MTVKIEQPIGPTLDAETNEQVRSSIQRLATSLSELQAVVVEGFDGDGGDSPDAPVADTQTRMITLAEPVGAGRAVTNGGYAVDGSDIASVKRYGGIILSAGIVGDELPIERSGKRLEFATWNFAIGGAIYINHAGALTQNLADGYPYFVVGYAATPDTIDLHPSVIIQRG